VGKIGQSVNQPAGVTVAAAGLASMLALAAVAVLVRSLTRFNAEGTARIENAKGATGSVYVNIPARHEGTGRVQLELQNRTVELQAVTFGHALESGTNIVVVAVIPPDTVEVIAAAQQRLAHG
jgi:hypothetical protein